MVQGIGPQWLCPIPFGFPETPAQAAQQLAFGLGLAENAMDAFMQGSGSCSNYNFPQMQRGGGGCPQPYASDVIAAQQQIIQNLLLMQQMQQMQQLGPMGALDPFGCSGPQPAQGMDTRTACEVLKKHFDTAATGKFKSIDKKSLENIVASDSAPPELKMAANTLLNNPTAIDQIAGAHKDPFTNGITMADLNTVTSPGNTTLDGIDQSAVGMHAPGSFEESAAVLKKHWDTVATGKFKTVDKESLEKVLASDSAPPELKAAANAILNHPDWLGRIAGAHSDCGFIGDGRITEGDINTVLSPGWGG